MLDWNAGAGPPTSGAYGSALATAPAGNRLFLGGAVAVSATGQRDLFAAVRSSGAAAPWTPNAEGRQLAVRALAVQAGEGGRAAVVYAAHVPFVQGGAPGTIGAFDAATGARLAWDPRAYASGRATTLVLAERTGWVVAAGSFPGAGPGGHANLVAVRPAVPFVVAGEPGATAAPAASALALSGPNPFRSRTALALTLAAGGPVEATLYDVLGRRVATLHDGPLAAGTHTLSVDGSAFPAGVYVARVTGDGLAEALTLTVVR